MPTFEPSAAASTKAANLEQLAPLCVIDQLTVGPVIVEPNRVTAPYQVEYGSKRDQTELSFRYEEDVFDPDDPTSVNLANMLVAQLALNYGLFCRRILFRGQLDQCDRRFLKAMAKNTAREIYVNKLLMPNVFLVEPDVGIPTLRLKSYLQAELEVEPSGYGKTDYEPWKIGRNRYAVLSSGGKDSLLTYGLLNELGYEAHPIFVNESGRHRFTALNAYRHFSERVPQTARVWTSSDRVFAWMLRHLPFVRKDFAKLRSDEYPIRLWTVAIFVFAALPLLRKRGIGRLLVGDEYDTTQTLNHEGIKHHDGLYDQSRLFDEALTRYFCEKQWGVAQFSVLRPLSELLIQKVLAERYPDLLRHQVSCHATHKPDEQVLPCGKCEKCRRIVGMLTAVGVDARLCGYTSEQMERCFHNLEQKGVHQERSAIEHLGYLLGNAGTIATGKLGEIKARRRSEVEKLRFDNRRSPPAAVPVDIREKLWRILLEHSEGAVERRGRVWVNFEPLDDPAALSAPYPFDSPESNGQPAIGGCVLGEMTWPKARARLREVDLALLPVGSIEQHGPHLPLDTDAFDAEYLALRVAERCSRPQPIVLPLVPYGVAYHHEDFDGTVSIGPNTLSQLVYDVGMSLTKQGITKLVIINGHGGNSPALKFAAQLINRDGHIFTTVDTGETSDADVSELIQTRNDAHAGEIETSTSLATRPQLVDMDAAVRFVPEFSNRYLDFSSKRSVEWYARTAKISPSGVLGDPTCADAEKGRQIWDVMIRNLFDFVEQLKTMTLDEIYQRRY